VTLSGRSVFGLLKARFALKIPPDIEQYVRRNFQDADTTAALGMLEGAVLHDGRSADFRMLRCALAACDNTRESLEYHVAGLAVDYRDVILAGEYVREKGEYIRLRDLSKPFEYDAV
jgi:hypothetical protein